MERSIGLRLGLRFGLGLGLNINRLTDDKLAQTFPAFYRATVGVCVNGSFVSNWFFRIY